jgi:hypothetical protein
LFAAIVPVHADTHIGLARHTRHCLWRSFVRGDLS